MSHLTLLLRISFVSIVLLITLGLARPAQACLECVDATGTENAIGTGADCTSAQLNANAQLNADGYPVCDNPPWAGPCRIHTWIYTACWWDGSQYEIEMERDYGCHPATCF
jgi:hypothetical protein